MTLDGKKVVDVEVDNVKSWDYPDFSDAHFSYAVFEETGIPLTDEELDQLADEYPETLNEMAYESLI